jgi:hypothetical protein
MCLIIPWHKGRVHVADIAFTLSVIRGTYIVQESTDKVAYVVFRYALTGAPIYDGG